jgi:hypothetical protein
MDEARLEQIRTGQRIILLSLLLNMVCLIGISILKRLFNVEISMQVALTIRAVFFLIGVTVGIFGVIRIGRGFEYPVYGRLLLALGLVIPLVGAGILLHLNGKATAVLKGAGYRVGLLGAVGRNG